LEEKKAISETCSSSFLSVLCLMFANLVSWRAWKP
jgi:hypothetical protein